jgi:hypothetical protein
LIRLKLYAFRLAPFLYFFNESFDLYVVSAREEFPALPGAAEGGIIPLFAAESGPKVAAVSVFFGGVSEEFPQEAKASAVHVKAARINFFIK